MTTRMRLAALAFLGSLLAFGCGGDNSSENVAAGSQPVSDPSAEQASDVGVFGECPGNEEPDLFAPPIEFAASAVDWVHVDEVVSATREPDGERFTFEAEVRSTSGTMHVIRVHASYWPGVDYALANAGDAWLALGSEELYGDPPIVIYALGTTDNGEVYFPGECAERHLGDAFRSEFGEQLPDVVGSMVGLTGSELATALDFQPDLPPTEQVEILNPDTVSPGVLAGLQYAAVHFRILETSEADYTVCTRSSAGWNDCITLQEQYVSVDAYLPPDGALEVWLLDGDANLSNPILQLGALTVPSELRDSGEIVLDVELAPGGSSEFPITSATLLEAAPIEAVYDLDLPGLVDESLPDPEVVEPGGE